MSDNAAHRDHYISHSWGMLAEQVGMTIGMGVGIIAGAVIGGGVAGPIGLVCGIIALGNTGAQLGSWAGSYVGSAADSILGRPTTGWIGVTGGAETVFIGDANKRAARVEDPVFCPGGAAMDGVAMAAAAVICLPALPILAIAKVVDAAEGESHGAAYLAEGVKRIFVEDFNAARIGCKTSCAAEVSEGDPRVFFHGELGRLEGHELLEENEGLDDTLYWLDWLGNLAELVGAIAAALAGGTMLLAIAAAVAAMATLFKLMESITGEKVFGYGDDASFLMEAFMRGLYAAQKMKGNYKKKALAFAVVFAANILKKGNVPGAAKILKRIDEMGDEEPKRLPVIKRKRQVGIFG